MEIKPEKIFAAGAALASAVLVCGTAIKLYPEIKKNSEARTRKLMETKPKADSSTASTDHASKDFTDSESINKDTSFESILNNILDIGLKTVDADNYKTTTIKPLI